MLLGICNAAVTLASSDTTVSLSAFFAVVTLPSTILLFTASVAQYRLCWSILNLKSLQVVTASAAISAPGDEGTLQNLAVVTASAAISAARIVPSKSLRSLQHQLRYQRLESYRLKSFAVVTASSTITTNRYLSM
jgi:hypothetical protein